MVGQYPDNGAIEASGLTETAESLCGFPLRVSRATVGHADRNIYRP